MTDQLYAPAGQCVPIVTLTSKVLAELRGWAAEELPGSEDQLPLLGAAFCEAIVGPWATAEQLRLPARMVIWTYAFDDYIEREVTELADLDAFLDRCRAVVHTGRRDDGDPLLASLSGWQQALSELPGYPALASLWEEKVDRVLRGHRYDWVVGAERERGNPPDAGVEEYLDHADSITLWMVHLPRWIAYGGDEVPKRLDVLAPALDDSSVAVRLANDLATIERERSEPGQNNVLMYGVSEDWVRTELANRIAAVEQRLAPLVAENFLPAVGLIRLTEWSVGIYVGNDMRDVTGTFQADGGSGA
ncbi:MAG: terpene synthase family protein [Actinophytocola sp.]|uniref:terpene synthase family protein n=1 Tax=Actinophytocola sp. TaxID=1872138 RepID=UPI003D6A7F20